MADQSVLSQEQGPQPTGYIVRSRNAVRLQREVFPGEEPNYLWVYTHGVEGLQSFARHDDLEMVVLYAGAYPIAQHAPVEPTCAGHDLDLFAAAEARNRSAG